MIGKSMQIIVDGRVVVDYAAPKVDVVFAENGPVVAVVALKRDDQGNILGSLVRVPASVAESVTVSPPLADPPPSIPAVPPAATPAPMTAQQMVAGILTAAGIAAPAPADVPSSPTITLTAEQIADLKRRKIDV